MAENTITIKKAQEEGDTHKVLEMIFETANELVPKTIWLSHNYLKAWYLE